MTAREKPATSNEAEENQGAVGHWPETALKPSDWLSGAFTKGYPK